MAGWRDVLQARLGRPMSSQIADALYARIKGLRPRQPASTVVLGESVAQQNWALIHKLFPTQLEVEESFRAVSEDNKEKSLEERIDVVAEMFGEMQVGHKEALSKDGPTLEQKVADGVVKQWVSEVLSAADAPAVDIESAEAPADKGAQQNESRKVRAVVVAGLVYVYLVGDPRSIFVLPNSTVEERIKDPAMVFEKQEEAYVEATAQALRYDGTAMYPEKGPACTGRKGGWVGEGKLLGVEFLRSSTEILPVVFPSIDYNGKLHRPLEMQLAMSRPLPNEVLFSGDSALSDGCAMQEVVFPMLSCEEGTAYVFDVPEIQGQEATARTVHLVPFSRGPAANQTWHSPVPGGALLLAMMPPSPMNSATFMSVVQETLRGHQLSQVEGSSLVQPASDADEPTAELPEPGTPEFQTREQDIEAFRVRVAETVDPTVVVGARALGSPHWALDTTMTIDVVRTSALTGLLGVTERGLKTVFMGMYDHDSKKMKQLPDTHVSHTEYNVTMSTHIEFPWDPRVVSLRAERKLMQEQAAGALDKSDGEPPLALPPLPPLMKSVVDSEPDSDLGRSCKELSAINVSTRVCLTSERLEMQGHIASCTEDLCTLVMGKDAAAGWRESVKDCTPLQRAWIVTKHINDALLRRVCIEEYGVGTCTEDSVASYLADLRTPPAERGAPPAEAKQTEGTQPKLRASDAGRTDSEPEPDGRIESGYAEVPSAAEFEGCDKFDGVRPGREFKTGVHGTGYYAAAEPAAEESARDAK